jgi:16S rRNA (adenine1518-N6/adenine1519-N6)-dimethyltransferase
VAHLEGIRLKKKYGQHFLHDESVVHSMLNAVALDTNTSVFEIGCGEGFLTRRILQTPIARLWVFEIDSDWANHIQKTVTDKRLSVFLQNFLESDLSLLEPHSPWTILANLPYQVTFPIIHRFREHKHLIKEGVVMVQEEVAQKITKKSGRGYGFISLFLQWHFDWRLLQKISPTAFFPPPKVDSRLLYFKPRMNLPDIPKADLFWRFIKICFKQPRRTLRNNLAQAHYAIDVIPEKTLALRSQQLNIDDFLALWELLHPLL